MARYSRSEWSRYSRAEQKWKLGGSTVQPLNRLSQHWAHALTHWNTSPIFHVYVPSFRFLVIFVAGSFYSRTVFYYLITFLLSSVYSTSSVGYNYTLFRSSASLAPVKSLLSGCGLPSVTFHLTSVTDVNYDFQIAVNSIKCCRFSFK